MRKLKFLFSIYLLLNVVDANAQIDSASQLLMKKVNTSYINEKLWDRNQIFLALDTITNRDEIYNPMYFKHGIFQDLGNICTPGKSLIFNFDRQVDFSFIQNPYETYFFNAEQATYYNTKIPYTDFTYAQGRVEMMFLKARHSQNINPRWNIGIDYFGPSSFGFYPRQNTNPYFTQLFTSYKSKNGKYAMLGNVNWNLGINEESGGLISDSAFNAIKVSNKTGNVKLEKSSNGFRNRSAYLKQYFYFGKHCTKINAQDTTTIFESRGNISHTIKVEEFALYFRNNGDSNAQLFPQKYYDTSNVSFDSISNSNITNKIAYTLYNNNKKNEIRYLQLAATHKYIYTFMRDKTETYNNVIIEGTLERTIKKANAISINLHAAYCPIGYNQNDMRLSGNASTSLRWFDIKVGLFNHLLSPDFTMLRYNTNNFIWDNNFNKINVSNFNLSLHTKKLKQNFLITYNQYVIANWIYFGNDATPKQSSEIGVVQTLEIRKTFQLGKFYFDNQLIYQNSTKDFIRLPDLGLILRYYFQHMIFKKAVKLQVGFDVFYNSAFYGNAYNPATHAFYLQNESKIGNYPLVNVFATCEIRKAVFFMVYEHLNQDLTNNYGYYNTPNYPIGLSSFKIGIRWRMYN